MTALQTLAGITPARSRVVTAIVDAAAFAAMVAAAGLAFGPSYGGSRWLVAVLAGAVLGAVIGSGAALARWPVTVAVVATAVGYLLFGAAVATPTSAIAGVVPSVESLRLLALGVVGGWKQMLTVADPIGSGGALLVPAFLAPLVAAVVGTSIAGRARRPLWALAAPLAVLAVAALLGTLSANHPAVTGTVVGVVALMWGAWRTGGLGSAGMDVRRPLSLAAVLIGAVAAALFAAPLVAPTTAREALRVTVQPPFDPQTYPSPLSAFRTYVKADSKQSMITVAGLPKGDRIRVATMDDYNGLFYDVSTVAGDFQRVGDEVRTSVTGSPVDLQVQVDGYAGVWLPDIGSLTSISFGGPRAAALQDAFRYSKATGTGVVTAGLKSGDSYRISAVVPAAPDKGALEQQGIGSSPIAASGRVPDALKAAAATWTNGKATVYDKVEAIRAALVGKGLLSHGDTLPSPSGHGFDRLVRLMNDKKMVGDQEQFAPAMALMVQSLGIPARVVLGFAPEKNDGTGRITLTGADMSAWVEVDFDQAGWVAFDPTPDVSRVQQQATPKPNAAPRRQVLQPPPPPRTPQDATAKNFDDTNSKDADKTKQDDSKHDGQSSGAWVVAAGAGVPALLIVGPIAVVLLLKRRRRRRHRRSGGAAGGIAGGWEQLIDGAVDLGAGVPQRLTRMESAAVMDRHFDGSTAVLARAADARVYGPGEPDPADADGFWSEVDAALHRMRGTVSPWRRLRAKVSTTSLRRGGIR